MAKRVLIIGGGASGMTAAVFAARQGASVTILEHMDRVGKKILSTGNGKCNLTNRYMEAECFRSEEPSFPVRVLEQFGESEAETFFKELGIVLKDRGGYLYPASSQASSVLDALREELNRRRVTVITDCGSVSIQESGLKARKSAGTDEKKGQKKDKRWRVSCQKGEFFADALILSTGSKAAPHTGSDGSGYRLAKELGHQVIKPLPALVQLRCRESFFKQISGVRTDGRVTLVSEGQILAEDQGELQLTDYGISGIPVFQVSRYGARALDKGKKVTAVLDFYPEMSKDALMCFLQERKKLLWDREADSFFTGWFNKKLSVLFLKLAKIRPDRKTETLTEEELSRLAGLIKRFETEITAVNPFENAQICCGGVDVREVDPKTMESKKKKGLYLTGELLDVDGICGGYNLQWAWSTGAVAGIHAGI